MRLSVLFSLLLVTACVASVPEQKTVGVLVPLTGEYASLGIEIQRGIELANGEAAHPVRIIYEDVGSLTPAKAITPASKLLTIDKVSVGLVTDSQNAVVLGPVFTQHGIPLVVMWDSSEEIIGSGEQVFSTGFSSEQSARGMATYAYETLGLRSVAIVRQQDPYAVVIAEAFTDEFTKRGGTIVLSEEHALNEQDFRTTLAKIKTANADGIYLAIVPQSEVSFTKQARALVPGVTLLAADWYFSDTIAAAGDDANGVYLHTIYVDKDAYLAEVYETKYGDPSPDIATVGIGYTAMKTVLSALEREESPSVALTQVIGPSRTLARQEKVYKVVAGVPVLQN